MAKDKKSFLLYADLIHTVNQLPDDKAGELFKHVLSYVNDENPETDDVLIKVAFEPIKQFLKRDLEKYEKIVKRNAENGKRGGRPRKAKEPSGLNENPTEPQKADSDSGSDSVIGKEGIIEDVSGSKKEPDTTSPSVDEKEPKKYDYSKEIELLNKVRFLFDSKYYTTPAGRKSWLDVIRLLNVKDGYSYELIEEVIKFGRSDQFWKINFLSISGLRKVKDGVSKFDKMLAAKGGSEDKGIKKFVSKPLGSNPSSRSETVEKFKSKKLG